MLSLKCHGLFHLHSPGKIRYILLGYILLGITGLILPLVLSPCDFFLYLGINTNFLGYLDRGYVFILSQLDQLCEVG